MSQSIQILHHFVHLLTLEHRLLAFLQLIFLSTGSSETACFGVHSDKLFMVILFHLELLLVHQINSAILIDVFVERTGINQIIVYVFIATPFPVDRFIDPFVLQYLFKKLLIFYQDLCQ